MNSDLEISEICFPSINESDHDRIEGNKSQIRKLSRKNDIRKVEANNRTSMVAFKRAHPQS
jgi:hypothetical protein